MLPAHLRFSPPQHVRGPNILILDTSAAVPLSLPVPDAFLDHQSGIAPADFPQSYLDLLAHLPPQVAAEIHIPDVVVQEWIGYTCMRDAQGTLTATHTVPEYSAYPTYPQAYRFLESALTGEGGGLPKIVIDCSPEGAEYVSKYLDLPTEGPQRKAAIDALREQGKNLGEKRCAQLAFDHIGRCKATVHVLMDDGGGFGLIANTARAYKHEHEVAASIAAFNSRAFLNALQQEGLLWQAGFRDGITEETISSDLVARQNAAAQALGNGHIYYLPHMRAEGISFDYLLQQGMKNPPSLAR